MQTRSDLEVVVSPSRHWQWARVADAARISGVPRSRLFELIRSGELRSAVLRHQGKQRGIRLIDMVSLDQLIASNAVGGQAKSN